MTTGAQLVIFAKEPVPGQVKTRLAATIGDTAAAMIYHRMLAQNVQRLKTGPWQASLSVAPDCAVQRPQMFPPGPKLRPQGGGDLGARMWRVLAEARADAPVVLVGSDIPGLAGRHVAAAFAALEDNDLVIGPSRDGGFYLIGARCCPAADIFAGVAWSQATTLAQVLANCAVKPAQIAMLDDCDDWTDFERHAGNPDWMALLEGVEIERVYAHD
jgi:rSAM/selenodomain-associated transferase 1